MLVAYIFIPMCRVSEKFGQLYSTKLLPLILSYGNSKMVVFLAILDILSAFSILYLFFSALLKPYSKNYQILYCILIVLSLSVLYEWLYFFHYPVLGKIYFVAMQFLYFSMALRFHKELKA